MSTVRVKCYEQGSNTDINKINVFCRIADLTYTFTFIIFKLSKVLKKPSICLNLSTKYYDVNKLELCIH